MHFGLYLKKHGIISAEQLVAALEMQLNSLVPIGQLALEEGILSARDIFTILRTQSDSPNIRFGDLAIEMGLMNRGQLMQLLMLQADRKRPVSEILVLQGILTERQSAEQMAAYRRAQMQPRHAATTTRVVPAPRRQDATVRTAHAVTAV